MPKAKRSPIDYTPQFGGGIFRSQEAIAEELAELAETDANEIAAESPELDAAPVAPAPTRPPRSTPKSRLTNERTFNRPLERTIERMRVRHSFDVWQDQLLGLSEIQADRFSRTGKKPKLGELVQEALDAYIAKERKRTNVRTNE